ncbi:hypothetical protein ACHAWC_009010 [Mediolabrus comicus]
MLLCFKTLDFLEALLFFKVLDAFCKSTLLLFKTFDFLFLKTTDAFYKGVDGRFSTCATFFSKYRLIISPASDSERSIS